MAIPTQIVRWQDGTYDSNNNTCLLCMRKACYGMHGLACKSGCENPVYQLEDRYKEVKSNGQSYRD